MTALAAVIAEASASSDPGLSRHALLRSGSNDKSNGLALHHWVYFVLVGGIGTPPASEVPVRCHWVIFRPSRHCTRRLGVLGARYAVLTTPND